MDSVIEGSEEFSVALSIAAGGESFATVADGQAHVVIERDPRTFGNWCDGRERGRRNSYDGFKKKHVFRMFSQRYRYYGCLVPSLHVGCLTL